MIEVYPGALESILSHKDNGWDFRVGNPEFFRFKDQLVVPGGKVLDLGIGSGRSSNFFALYGMEVEGIDLDPDSISYLEEFSSETGLPIAARLDDIKTAQLPVGRYHVAILDYAFVHFDSKKYALDVIQKAYDSLVVGGHLWVRGVGKDDGGYSTMAKTPPYSSDRFENDDVRYASCGCSGEVMIEPHLFLGSTDLLQFATSHNMQLIHTQTLPQPDTFNLMYGHEFARGRGYGKVNGHVTLLARK
ncbi:MAG: class I SAM-dependent methyltransferase [Candidatus Roizmanbacteria bacterium]